MSTMALEQELATLRERVRIAEHENRELKGEYLVPRLRSEFHLSWSEAKILAALTQNESLTREKLLVVLYGEYCDVLPGLIREFILRLRRKLKPHKIFITTKPHRGDGWYLHPIDKAKFGAL
jgi:DNA-binding response OmpR family regulator